MSPREIQKLRERLSHLVDITKQARDSRIKRIRRGYANQAINELRDIDTELDTAYHRAFEE